LSLILHQNYVWSVTYCVGNAFYKTLLKEKQENRRQGRRRKHLPADLKEKRIWKPLDCTFWRTHVGRGYGPLPRKLRNERTSQNKGASPHWPTLLS